MEALMIPIKPRWFIPIANKKKKKKSEKIFHYVKLFKNSLINIVTHLFISM